jgi:hypothetical protein
MFRRHWITLLIAAVLAYFGVTAAPVLASLATEPEPQIIAMR